MTLKNYKQAKKLSIELDLLIKEIEEYNSHDDFDDYGYGDQLEARRIDLIDRLTKEIYGENVIVVNFKK